MEMNIEAKTKEPLLSRLRVSGNLAFEATTPSKAELAKAIAHATKADENLIVVKKIDNSFGKRSAKFEACVYDDEKTLQRVEPKPKKKAEAAAPK